MIGDKLLNKPKIIALFARFVSNGLPLLIFLMVGAITLLFWSASWRYIEQYKHNQDKMAAVTLRDIVNEDITSRKETLSRMASRWKLRRGGTPYAEWSQDALNIVADEPGYQAIEWVDAQYSVRWIAPLKPNEAAISHNLATEKIPFQAVQKAIEKNTTTTSPVFTLQTGDKGFFINAPIKSENKFQGLIVGVINVKPFFDEIFHNAIPGYNIEIHADNQLIYQRNSEQDQYISDNGITIESKDFGWTITTWANPRIVGIQNSWLPTVILMIGFIICLMLSLISYLAQVARNNANKALDEIKTRKKTEQQLIVYSRKLKKLSLIDPLTGVHNRRSLSTILQQEIVHLKDSEMSLSVILLDIDHFKAINDTYGHVTGDTVLHKVGDILRKNSRSTDTVARYGGEEFFIVLRNTPDRQAYILAEKLRLLIAEQKFLCEKKIPFQVTCSFGVYQIPAKEKKIMQVFGVVDGALYAAKNSGRNCVVLV